MSKVPQFVPYYLSAFKDSLKATDVILATDLKENDCNLNEEAFTPSIKIGNLKTYALTEQDLTMENWRLMLPENAKRAKQMLMVLRIIV